MILAKYPSAKIDIQPDYDGPPGRITIKILEKGNESANKALWTGTRSQAQSDVENILKLIDINLNWAIMKKRL